MRFKNQKLFSLEFCFYLTMAIILLWPFFVKAESVVLNTPATSCIGSSGQVNLTWSSDIPSPSYYILRSTAGEATSTIGGPISDTFFTDNNIVSDKIYFYQIRAESGTSTYFSNEVQVPPLYCPAVLSIPTPSCQTDGPHISLNWSAASGNMARYEIYRDITKIGETVNTNFDDNQSNNLEGTQNYNYFIKTVWQSGHTEDSQTAQIQAPACPPILSINPPDCATEAPGGPIVSLSWNNLLGIQNYQIFRKTPGAADFSFLATTTITNLTDNLVESFADYAQGGQVSYYVKAIWLTDLKDSATGQTNISRCAPYLTVASVCNSSGLLNPEMRLSWTATQGVTLYNIYRDGSFYTQITNPNVNDFIDYLDPSPSGDCSNKICTHTYKIEAVVTGFPNFPSNQVTKDIDCATPIPPSPEPVLNPASAYCVSGDSRVYISWTASDNIVYYSLYRNGIEIIKRLETYYEDSGIQSGQTYTYQVRAFGKGGTFTDSPNSQTIAAVDCTPPSASTLTAISTCESGKPVVNLSWMQTSNTETYEIWRGPSTTNLSFLMSFDKTAPEFTSRTWKDTTVSGATTYYYRVVSKGPTGVPPTNSTNTPNVTTSSCLPTAPSLTITPACQSGNPAMNLSWTDGGTNTAYYEIFRQDYMGGTTPYQTILNPRTTSWRDTGVLPDTNYTYKIDAIGFLGNRVGQGWRPPKTALNCSAPGPFTLNEPNIYCQGPYPRANLSWSASTNATSYDLNRLLSQPTTFYNVSSPFTDWGLGNALSFDGSDWVYIGDTPSLKVTGDLTISFWAYPTNISITGQNALGKYSYSEFYLSSGSNGLLYYYHGDGYNYMYCYAFSVYENNKWVHVAITRNIAAKSVTIYKNGIAQPTTCTAWRAPSASTQPFRIGYSGYNPWRGLLDEVRIYNRSLTSGEVASVYQGNPSDSGIVGLWHFDEDSGQDVSDSSNSNNNGFANNGTLGNSTAVESNDPTWVKNGLQWESQYNWQARAIGPGGSTLSNTTNPNTIPFCVPTKPGLVLNSFCSGLTNMTLRWSFTTKTAKYEIYREGKGLIKTINQGDPEFNSRIWTDTNGGAGLGEQTSYTYYIKAIGPTALENQSDSISTTTPNCLVPPAPQNLTATFACGGTGNSYPRVNLSWSTATNTTYYTVFRSTAGGPYAALTPPPTTPSFTDTNVNVNTNYSYYVTAYGPGGASLPSAPASTATGYCLPSTPSITSLTTACESNSPANTISWSDSTSFNTFTYEIYRNTVNTIPGTPIKTIASTTPEFTSRIWKDNSGLSSLTTYYYWVRAVGPAGQRTSSSKTITTYSCGLTPSAPTLNLDNLFCQDNLPYATLSWNSVTNAYSYNLYRTNPDSSTSIYSTRLSPLTDRGSFALGFDGYDDYISVNNSSSLNPKNITIEAWVYPSRFYYYDYIFYKSFFLRFYSNTGRLQAYFYTSAGDRSCLSSTAVQVNKWSHVVATYDGLSVKIYLDGNNICTSNYPTAASLNSNSYSARIGSYYTTPNQNYRFKGAMDELRIYGRALTQSEVSEHLAGVYKNEADLRAVWHLDEGTGSTAVDQSGNNNTGTLYNGPAWQTDSPTVLKILALENSKTYKYKVKAFGADTESAFSNEISTTTPSCLPAKPDLVITPQCIDTNSQLKLSWQPDANTLYWSLYKRREGDILFKLATTTTQISASDGDIESGINYEYYVEAVGKGVSIFSDAVTEKAPSCYPLPSKPIISATSTCYGYSSRIKIDWQPDPLGNTISYNIWRKNTTLSEPEFTILGDGRNLPASAIQYIDTVTENQKYIYKVEAVGAGTGNNIFSDPSNEVTSYECSKIPPFPPNLYVNLIYSVDHNVAVSIGWTDAGNEEDYKVFRRLASEPGFAYNNPLVTLNADILNYVDYTVTDGLTYEYQVMASNINGSTLSNIIQVPVPIARPGDFILSALRLADLRIYLTWIEALTSVAGGEVTYDILRSSTPNFESFNTICSDIVTPRECFDNDPPLLSSVYYKALATNIGGVTESNVIKVGMPIPIWKEILPW